MARADAAGIPVSKLEMTGTSLPHDQDERFENLSVPAAMPTTEGLTTGLVRTAKLLEQKDLRQARSFLTNSHIFMDNRRAGRVRAVTAGIFGEARVTDHTGRAIDSRRSE